MFLKPLGEWLRYPEGEDPVVVVEGVCQNNTSQMPDRLRCANRKPHACELLQAPCEGACALNTGLGDSTVTSRVGVEFHR